MVFIISLGFTFSGIAQTAGTLSFSFNEVSKPTVQATDILIEVKAAAINPIDKLIIGRDNN